MARVHPIIDAEIKRLIDEAAKKGVTPSFPISGSYDSEVKVGSLSDAANTSTYWCDGRDVKLPVEVFQALINAAGGCVVLDGSDILNADKSVINEVVEVVRYTDPLKIIFRVVKRND